MIQDEIHTSKHDYLTSLRFIYRSWSYCFVLCRKREVLQTLFSGLARDCCVYTNAIFNPPSHIFSVEVPPKAWNG